MSRDIDNIMKEVMKQTKDIHNVDARLSKDILDLKKHLKNIEDRSKSIDKKLTQIISIINNITIFIEDAEDISDEDIDEVEDWTPYNEHGYDPNEYDNDEENEGYL